MLVCAYTTSTHGNPTIMVCQVGQCLAVWVDQPPHRTLCVPTHYSNNNKMKTKVKTKTKNKKKKNQ